MKTACTALGTLSACAAVRWYLNWEGRADTEYAGGRVRLTALWNSNGAFGLKLPQKLLLPLSGALLGTVWLRRRHSPMGAGLLLGGGLSNLLERQRHGKVYDYIRFPKLPVPFGRFVFNLADFAILAGAAALSAGETREQQNARRQ